MRPNLLSRLDDAVTSAGFPDVHRAPEGLSSREFGNFVQRLFRFLRRSMSRSRLRSLLWPALLQPPGRVLCWPPLRSPRVLSVRGPSLFLFRALAEIRVGFVNPIFAAGAKKSRSTVSSIASAECGTCAGMMEEFAGMECDFTVVKNEFQCAGNDSETCSLRCEWRGTMPPFLMRIWAKVQSSPLSICRVMCGFSCSSLSWSNVVAFSIGTLRGRKIARGIVVSNRKRRQRRRRSAKSQFNPQNRLGRRQRVRLRCPTCLIKTLSPARIVHWCACAALLSVSAAVSGAQTIHVDASKPSNTIDPAVALGAGIDRIPFGAADKLYVRTQSSKCCRRAGR